MNKHKKIIIATLPALALVVLGASVASAYGGPDLMFKWGKELSEEQRAAIEEARELRKEGDNEAARDVLKDAGLDPKMRGPKMMRMLTDEERDAFRAKHEAIRAAIEAEDFEAFKDATAGMPFADMVTEENFEKLLEAHELMEAGDKEGAFEIFKDLEMPPFGHGHMMHHMKFKEGGRE
jgi:hypothetical protein